MKLPLRNVLIFCAAFLAVLVFVFSFLTSIRFANGSGNWNEWKGIIWGAGRINYNDGSAQILANDDKLGAIALPLVGAILVFLGGVCAVVTSLVVKDQKVAKIVLFAAAGLLVLGGVFSFFVQNGFYQAYATKHGISVENAKSLLTSLGYDKVSCGLPVVSGILAILAGGAVAASQFVPDKKLGK